jgi:hypothetical protein
MNTAMKTLSVLTLCCSWAGLTLAQQAPPSKQKQTPQSEAGEPQADTSGPAAGPVAAPVAPVAAAGAAPASQPRAAKSGRAAAGAGQKSAGANDKLALGTATVTGSQEQPKVMYIVPWKRSDIGDMAGKPMNSLVDEILAPVDRDVFKREVVYYQAVQADASQNGAQAKPSQQGEK